VPLMLSVSGYEIGNISITEYETSVKIRERDPDEFISSYIKRSVQLK